MEEIDALLHGLASAVRWSSPAIRAARATRSTAGLQDMYRRLDAREAKWLTRLVLKNYSPMILDSLLVYDRCHSILPSILLVQDDFTTAINTLQAARRLASPGAPRPPSPRAMMALVNPKLGVKVGRQDWLKARSIKHCVSYCSGRMSVEEKIDGEYCQIHVDATACPPRIQIFSKSGKDSTEDRQGIRG